MADKKIEKALYGPSTTEVALGALLGFLLGVVVAVVYLVWKPVLRVMEMPKTPVANAVYLVPGNENSVKARNWQAKVKALSTGGSASFNEEELNAFADTLDAPAKDEPAKPAPAAPPKPGEAPKDKPADSLFTTSGLNFRILKNDQLQVSVKCTINYYGISTDAFAVATGGFVRSGDNWTFQPETFYFGSCPLHKMPVGSAFLTSRILGALKLPDSMHLWDKITSLKVETGLLKVTTAP